MEALCCMRSFQDEHFLRSDAFNDKLVVIDFMSRCVDSDHDNDAWTILPWHHC